MTDTENLHEEIGEPVHHKKKSHKHKKESAVKHVDNTDNTESIEDDKLHLKKKSMKHKDKVKKIKAEDAKEFVAEKKKESKSNRHTKREDIIFKSNDDLRGSTSTLLIRGLPLNVKVHKLKKDLKVTPKSINLSKKDGQRSALVTFKSPGDCGESFDALQGYSYGGQTTTVSFVRPRSVVDIRNLPTPTCMDFLLDVSNIPFYVSLENLKSIFPKAEAIIQRCRHDRSFKGSCIVAFASKEDRDEAEVICKEKPFEGRELTCEPTTGEACTALLEEIKQQFSTPKGKQEGTQIKLYNLPYTITAEELKKIFPQARNIFFPKNKKGEPTGIGLLSFKTKFICNAALEKAKKTEIQGRKIRAEINTFKPSVSKDNNMNGKGKGPARGKFNKDKSVKHRRMKLKNQHQPDGEVKLNVD